jgi:hypothetical protein
MNIFDYCQWIDVELEREIRREALYQARRTHPSMLRTGPPDQEIAEILKQEHGAVVLSPGELKKMLQEYAALWESQLQTADFYLKSKGIDV